MKFVVAALLATIPFTSAVASEPTRTICKAGRKKNTDEVFGRVAINQRLNRKGNAKNAIVNQRWFYTEAGVEYQLSLCPSNDEASCCDPASLSDSAPIGSAWTSGEDGSAALREKVEGISVIGDDSAIGYWLQLTKTGGSDIEACCQIQERE